MLSHTDIKIEYVLLPKDSNVITKSKNKLSYIKSSITDDKIID